MPPSELAPAVAAGEVGDVVAAGRVDVGARTAGCRARRGAARARRDLGLLGGREDVGLVGDASTSRGGSSIGEGGRGGQDDGDAPRAGPRRRARRAPAGLGAGAAGDRCRAGGGHRAGHGSPDIVPARGRRDPAAAVAAAGAVRSERAQPRRAARSSRSAGPRRRAPGGGRPRVAPRTRIRSVFVARPASSPHSRVILRLAATSSRTRPASR